MGVGVGTDLKFRVDFCLCRRHRRLSFVCVCALFVQMFSSCSLGNRFLKVEALVCQGFCALKLPVGEEFVPIIPGPSRGTTNQTVVEVRLVFIRFCFILK